MTLIAAITLEGAISQEAARVIEGATEAQIFEYYYIEHFLAPWLWEGQVVVGGGDGRLSAHPSYSEKVVGELIERSGGVDVLAIVVAGSEPHRSLEDKGDGAQSPSAQPRALVMEAIARGCLPSRSKMERAGLDPAGTTSRINLCEHRCRCRSFRTLSQRP